MAINISSAVKPHFPSLRSEDPWWDKLLASQSMSHVFTRATGPACQPDSPAQHPLPRLCCHKRPSELTLDLLTHPARQPGFPAKRLPREDPGVPASEQAQVNLAPHSNQPSFQPGPHPGISNLLQDSGYRAPLTASTPFSLVKALAFHPFQWAVCLWHP